MLYAWIKKKTWCAGKGTVTDGNCIIFFQLSLMCFNDTSNLNLKSDKTRGLSNKMFRLVPAEYNGTCQGTINHVYKSSESITTDRPTDKTRARADG